MMVNKWIICCLFSLVGLCSVHSEDVCNKDSPLLSGRVCMCSSWSLAWSLSRLRLTSVRSFSLSCELMTNEEPRLLAARDSTVLNQPLTTCTDDLCARACKNIMETFFCFFPWFNSNMAERAGCSEYTMSRDIDGKLTGREKYGKKTEMTTVSSRALSKPISRTCVWLQLINVEIKVPKSGGRGVKA